MTDSQAAPPRDRWFAAAVAVALVVVLCAQRIASGAGFGCAFVEREDGTVASGVVEYPEDDFAYLTHIAQARGGAWSFVNAFAYEEQAPIYWNPLFLVLGKVARAAGIEGSGALQIAGLMAAVVVVLAAHAIARRAGLDRAGARWAVLLVAFGSGLSVFGAVLSPQGSSDLIGVDRTHQDTVSFSTFAVYPFQAVTLAVLALAILAALRSASHGARRGDLALVFALTLLGGAMRPYECVAFAASLALWAVASGAPERRARLLTAGVAAGAAVPAIAYALWIGSQPAWRDYATVTMEALRIPRLAWLIGFGAFLPAAVIGALALRHHANARLLALWVGGILVLVVGINIAQTKFASGVQLPLAVLAGAGCAAVQHRVRRRAAATVVLLVAGALFFATSLHLLLNVWIAHRFDAELATCADEVIGTASAPPVVLCPSDAGTLLPGLAPCRVVVGHWSMTPSRDARRERLLAAGVEVDSRRPDVTPTAEAFAQLLAEVRPDLLLLARGSPAEAFARARGLASVRDDLARWCVLRGGG